MYRTTSSRHRLFATSFAAIVIASLTGCSSGQAENIAITELEKKGGTVIGEPTPAGISYRLNLNNSSVTNDDLKLIADISNVEVLWLYGTKVTDAGMVHVGELDQLKFLDLKGSQLTDVGLAHLTACKSLEVLSIVGTTVTAEGLSKFKQALPNCKITH
jgi:hypothetical protein